MTPELIIQVVSDHFGITPLDIASQKRTKDVVFPRQIAMYLCRTMTDTPLQTIGKYLGGRDHTTIIHGHDKILADMGKNESLRNTIEILKRRLIHNNRWITGLKFVDNQVEPNVVSELVDNS